MSLTRGRIAIVAAAVVLYFVVLMAVWAFQPLDDSVPVGVDWTPTTAAPPKPQREVSQAVQCNTLFDDEPRDEPLPELTPQPEGRPPLGYQREPCVLVHSDARRNMAINTVGVLAVLGALGFLAVRARPAGFSRHLVDGA